MKKYSISFGFSVTIGREDRPPVKKDLPMPTADLNEPVAADSMIPCPEEDKDDWLTPPEIKAVFDKRLAETNRETS